MNVFPEDLVERKANAARHRPPAKQVPCPDHWPGEYGPCGLCQGAGTVDSPDTSQTLHKRKRPSRRTAPR